MPRYDDFGALQDYSVFAEERASMNPPPVFELFHIFSKTKVVLVELPPTPRPRLKSDGRTTQTPTLRAVVGPTATLPIARRSVLRFFVRHGPFGHLGARGPAFWEADDQSRFVLRHWIFDSAGSFDVLFNVSLLDGTTLKFNRTIHVLRQADQIAHGVTPQGYNGSRWFPPISGSLRTFVGDPVPSSTAVVSLDLQSVPAGARVSGTLALRTSAAGSVAFSDFLVSIPGVYTYRLVATRSDGVRLYTSSNRIVVERALAERINIVRGISGIARFRFFSPPQFTISDSAGLSHDPRSNMSLVIVDNQPDFAYEGFEPFAHVLGTDTVHPVRFQYVFDEASIDLPGRYVVEARLALPIGGYIATSLQVRIFDPPVFEVPEPITVNSIGTLTLYGQRPRIVGAVTLRLATDQECVNVASDTVIIPTGATFPYNISIVPFTATETMHVCMAIPSQPSYGALMLRYEQQFDELFPVQYSFPVADLGTCLPLSDIVAAQYRVAGWETAEAGRRYGCRLTPPVAGTVPPCACPSSLTCETLRHPSFTPPNVDIGQCVCCEPGRMAGASLATTAVSLIIVAVILRYV